MISRDLPACQALNLACDYYGELVRRDRDRDKLADEVRPAVTWRERT